MMRAAGDSPEGVRLRGIIVVLWRAGLRISEALALNETDLDPGRGSLVVRHGKGDKRREVGMDRWAWTHLAAVARAPKRTCRSGDCSAWCAARHAGTAVRIRQVSERNCITPPRVAGVRRRFAPHQLRHAHAVEMSREGISLLVIQRQLGHADLAITSRYLRGIDNTEIIAAVHERPAPMIPADPQTATRR